jgi:hypothetical protein
MTSIFEGCRTKDGLHIPGFKAHCESTFALGDAFVLEVMPATEARTRLQEKGFHAMIAPWAKERGWQTDDLKRFLLMRIFGVREAVSPLTGGPILNEPHTSKLSKAKYSELIEHTLMMAAEDGYVLVAPNEFRERKEKKGKAA